MDRFDPGNNNVGAPPYRFSLSLFSPMTNDSSFFKLRTSLPSKYFYLFWGEYFYSFFRIILIFCFLCGKNILSRKSVMFKGKTTGLAGRKWVRLSPKGGSIPGVKPAWICRSMTELNQYLLPFLQVCRSLRRY